MFEGSIGGSDRLYGKYPGLVVNNKPPDGPETFQGQIRVKVSPILDEDRNPIEAWAKPCFHPGFFFIPEIDDNVWVEFVAGDINFPIWSGVWYPQGKTPKTASDEPPGAETKTIRTISGHVIEINDTGGSEQVVIKHMSGSTVELNEDGSVLVANSTGSFLFLNAADEEATLMDQHGNLIAMTTNGVLLANKDGTTAEMKEGKVKISASDTVQLMAKDVVVNSSTVSLGQQAMHPAVLGDLFLAMFDAHTHATAVGPTSPPIPPLSVLPPGTVLSRGVKVAM